MQIGSRQVWPQFAPVAWVLAAGAILLAIALAPATTLQAQDATPGVAGATPTAQPALGLSRLEPAAPWEEVVSGSYAATLLEAVQGEEAAARVAEADTNNPPPPDGQEYVVARVKVRNTGTSPEPIPVAPSNFGLTGTAARLHPAAPVVAPQPELRAELPPGGVVEGWVVLPVIAGETDRMLVVLPGTGADPQAYRYLAIEVGASLPPGGTPVADLAIGTPAAQPGTPPNDLGVAPDAPAGEGAVVVTDRFALQVLEVVRGDAASARLRAASLYNPGPLPDNENVLIRVRVTYLGPDEGPVAVSPVEFALTGRANVRYEMAGLVPPEPSLDARLYPGGTIEGYLAFEVARNDPNLSLVFHPLAEPEAAPRYLAAVPTGAAATPAP